jgi:hydroxymethylpyrimidine/phosphomethylpyrimidine kinase
MSFLKKSKKRPVMLTVAGSDSGSGAGIQMDIKTASALNVFCATAITSLTAQNPDEVIGIKAVAPAFIALEIEAVARAFQIKSAKTGMLYNKQIIRKVAAAFKKLKTKLIVIDPVCIATSGKALLLPQAVNALKEELLPLAYVITPNINEVEALLDKRVETLSDARDAAAELSRTYRTNCVVKGGHLRGDYVYDVLSCKGRVYIFKKKRIAATQTHGTGCMFSSALAALLAQGFNLKDAVARSQMFVWKALANPIKAGKHYPLL